MNKSRLIIFAAMALISTAFTVIGGNATAAVLQINSSTSIINTSGGLIGTGFGDMSVSGSFEVFTTVDEIWFNDIDVTATPNGGIGFVFPEYIGNYVGNNFSGSESIPSFPDNSYTGTFDGTTLSITGIYYEPVNDGFIYNYIINATVVPIPATIWLFGTGLLGLIGVARKKAT